MEQCDLQRKARRKLIGSLSKGFRQRVGIADALLAEPEVVIMDEPTIGLDPHQIQAMRALISSLRGQMTVILSSHILPEIEACCDRVIIINQGEVVAAGDTEALREEFIETRSFILEFSGDCPEVMTALRGSQKSPELRIPERPLLLASIHFQLKLRKTGIEGEDLLSVLSSMAGVTVRGLSPVKSTLEDVFMAATRRSWDEISEPIAPKTESAATVADKEA